MKSLLASLANLETICNMIGVLDPDARTRNNAMISQEHANVLQLLRNQGLVAGVNAWNNNAPMAYISDIVIMMVDVSIAEFNEDDDPSPYKYHTSLRIKRLSVNPEGLNNYGDQTDVREFTENEQVFRNIEQLIPYIAEATLICRDWQTTGMAGPILLRKISRGERGGGIGWNEAGGPTERAFGELCRKNAWHMQKINTAQKGIFQIFISPLGMDKNRSRDKIMAIISPDWTSHQNVHLLIRLALNIDPSKYMSRNREPFKGIITGDIQSEVEKAINDSIAKYPEYLKEIDWPPEGDDAWD